MTEQNGNPCMSCPGYCCSRNLIDVCGYDVWLIAHRLTLHPADFVGCAELPEDNKYCFRLGASDRSYQLVLNMHEHSDGSRRCMFGLNLPHDQFRCGIYSVRPTGCRSYPFRLQEDKLTIKPTTLCPQGSWSIADNILSSTRETVAHTDMEFDIYGRIVELWNGRVAEEESSERIDFGPFMIYMMDFYDRLDKVRELVPEGAWPSIWLRWKELIWGGNDPLASTEAPASGIWHDWITGTVTVFDDTLRLYWPIIT